MNFKMDHIVINAVDINASLRFYTDILELHGERIEEFKNNQVPFPSVRITSFRPETVLFRRRGVNLRPCLCGVKYYASAQALDFLATTKNSSFPIRKPNFVHREFPDGHYLAAKLRGWGDHHA